MNVYVTNISALRFWRNPLNSEYAHDPSRRTGDVSQCARSASELQCALDRLSFLGPERIHLFAPRQSSRPMRNRIAYHSPSSNLPPTAFCKISKHLYVASPEYCFASLSPELSQLELVLLGYELCGCYLLVPDESPGFQCTGKPLANTEAIAKTLDAIRGRAGTRKAREVMRWVLDGARSPMEAIVALRLCMPPRLGGQGIEMPVLNGQLELSPRAQEMARREHFACDLLWPEQRVALEYNGADTHASPEQAAYDYERESIIDYDGIRVITVTPRIESSPQRFEDCTVRLCKMLGRRYRKPSLEQLNKKMLLRSDLFAAERHIKALTQDPEP